MASGYEWVSRISVFIIIVSIAFIGVGLTGRAVTDTATVNITLVTSAAINFTTDKVNWGSGAVDNLATIAHLYTNGTVRDGNWSSVSNPLVLRNIGNINVTLNLSSDADAAGFIGGTNPVYQFKISNLGTNACVGNAASSYTSFTGSTQPACDTLQFYVGKDNISIDIHLGVPYDAVGTKGSVITATATAQ